MDGLWQLTLPYLCAGFIVQGGRIVQTAPILAWLRGKPLGAAWQYSIKKGGELSWVAP